MEAMYSVCCGADVHKKVIVCCLLRGRRKEIREFGASTKDLIELSSWLQESGCEMIAMESTASYWKPLYNILEAEGIPAMVVNAQHIKALPGRKTDTLDAEWIADLLRHGLLRASYIPSKPQRELRELLTYRKSLTADSASEQNRIQKMLEGGNIKISGTISSIIGMTGQQLLSCIIDGEAVSADDIRRMIADGLISSRLKATPEEIADDLNGVLTPVQRKMISICLEHIIYLNKRIDEIDSIIDDSLSPDMQELVALLKDIPGVGENSAKTILSVIGTDMSRFPTASHLASWAGVCPGNNESAGKRRSGRTRKGNALLRTTLVLCAQGASRAKGSFFSSQYSRLMIRRGKNRAKMAVAHSLLIAIYYVIRDRVPFRDLGEDYYDRFNAQSKVNLYIRKLEKLGAAPKRGAVKTASRKSVPGSVIPAVFADALPPEVTDGDTAADA